MNITLKLFAIVLLIPAEILALNLFWYALTGSSLLPPAESEAMIAARITAFVLSVVPGVVILVACAATPGIE